MFLFLNKKSIFVVIIRSTAASASNEYPQHMFLLGARVCRHRIIIEYYSDVLIPLDTVE